MISPEMAPIMVYPSPRYLHPVTAQAQTFEIQELAKLSYR
jgi:hypothetical protein